MFRTILTFLLLITMIGCATGQNQPAKTAPTGQTPANENPTPDYVNSPGATEPIDMFKKQTVDRSVSENLVIDVTDTSTKVSFLNKTQICKSKSELESFIRSNKSKFKEGKIYLATPGATRTSFLFSVMDILKKYELKAKLVIE